MVRIAKADAAFLYGVLEAQEGACAYSTVGRQPGDLHREIELLVPESNKAWVQEVLDQLPFPHEVKAIRSEG